MNRRQLVAFALLLVTSALLAYLTYALGRTDRFFAGQEMPPELANTPPWLIGLANAGIILLYGLLGLLGLWFARRPPGRDGPAQRPGGTRRRCGHPSLGRRRVARRLAPARPIAQAPTSTPATF